MNFFLLHGVVSFEMANMEVILGLDQSRLPQYRGVPHTASLPWGARHSARCGTRNVAISKVAFVCFFLVTLVLCFVSWVWEQHRLALKTYCS